MPSSTDEKYGLRATMSPAGRGQHYYPQLDGLRAAAVFLVLMNHMSDLSLPAPLAYVCALGWIGVDAFFVLSGFLITIILLSYKPGPRAFGVFMLRRVLRIWPLYFVIVLAAYFTILHDPAGMKINWLQYFFFLQNFAPEFIARSVGPTWSLCIEEHFYLVWPFLIFLLPRRALAWVLPAIFLSLPFIRFWGLHHAFTFKQLYTETQFHLDGLVAGSFAALLISSNSIRPRTLLRLAYTCLAVGISASVLGYWNGWDATEGHNVIFGFSTLAVSFTGLLLFLITGGSSFLGRVFSLGPVRYIGKISYGIYLLHAGLFSFLARLDHNRFMGAIEQRWILAIPLRVTLTVFVAALSFKLFESPILRLKDRVR